MSTALPLDVTFSVFRFLQVHPSGPPELGERRSPAFPLNLTTGYGVYYIDMRALVATSG